MKSWCISLEISIEHPSVGLASLAQFHSITLHVIILYYITLHYIALHYITLHYITLYCITLHFITLHCITLHCITLHYFTQHLHYITYCITLNYITLRDLLLICSSTLGSDIVASSLQCGTESCPTSNYTQQSSNVTITFEHSTKIQVNYRFN